MISSCSNYRQENEFQQINQESQETPVNSDGKILHPFSSFTTLLSAEFYQCRKSYSLYSFGTFQFDFKSSVSFCRAMLCISAAYAVMRCLSVCLAVCLCDCVSRSWILSKRITVSSDFFHRQVAKPFTFLHTKRYGDIPMETPFMGASNAGGICRNRDYEPTSGSIACCERFERQVQYT